MKNQTTFTPGPWTVAKGTNGFCDTWQVEHKSELRHATIADCGAIVNKVYQGSTDNYVGDKVNCEHEANARLIAAAPAMFDALIILTTTQGQTLSSKALDKALAAIAQARGEKV